MAYRSPHFHRVKVVKKNKNRKTVFCQFLLDVSMHNSGSGVRRRATECSIHWYQDEGDRSSRSGNIWEKPDFEKIVRGSPRRFFEKTHFYQMSWNFHGTYISMRTYQKRWEFRIRTNSELVRWHKRGKKTLKRWNCSFVTWNSQIRSLKWARIMFLIKGERMQVIRTEKEDKKFLTPRTSKIRCPLHRIVQQIWKVVSRSAYQALQHRICPVSKRHFDLTRFPCQRSPGNDPVECSWMLLVAQEKRSWHIGF